MQKKIIILILSTSLSLSALISDTPLTYSSIEILEAVCDDEEQSSLPSEPEILPLYEEESDLEKL